MVEPGRNLRTIDQQLELGGLDLEYWEEAGEYVLQWATDADIENATKFEQRFGNVEYYREGNRVATASQADEAWMENRRPVRRYFKYDAERGLAIAAAEQEAVTEITEIVGTLEGWNQSQDRRDELWQLLNAIGEVE